MTDRNRRTQTSFYSSSTLLSKNIEINTFINLHLIQIVPFKSEEFVTSLFVVYFTLGTLFTFLEIPDFLCGVVDSFFPV